MAGDRVTGVTIMQVVPALDAGPMLAHRSCSIEEQDTGGSLERKLAELGGELLGEVITRLAASPVEGRIQDPALVTYAAKISRTDRDLEWGRTASELARQVRALNPEPLALTNLRGLSVAISEAEALPAMTGAIAPGTILAWDPTGIVVATGAGRLRVPALQPSGKRVMSVRDFVNGYRHLRPL
jgi:methionyl-tRNA formyltransferase